jgi:hypothetical protein
MGAPFTLTQLLTPQTLADFKVQFLALLQAGGFPAITEWAGEPTGTEMTFVEMLCGAIDQRIGADAPVSKQLATIAAGQSLAWGSGDWLDLLVEQVYLLTRGLTTKTTFDMTLVSTPNAPVNEFQEGDVWLVGPTGKRYQSTTPGTLSPGSSVVLSFAAEQPGSTYADLLGSLTMVTGFAGVTLVPGRGEFSAVGNTGTSTGGIAPRRTQPTVAPFPHDFAIRIVDTGNVDAATWELSVDGGDYVFRGPIHSAEDLGDGTSVSVTDGAAPSFAAGDVFSFETPGGANRVQGNDPESDPRYAQRGRDRWPSQSPNVMDGKVRLWVSQVAPSVNRIRITPDNVVPNRFLATVADTHGSIDLVALQQIEQYVEARLNFGEGVQAKSAQPIFTFATGTVLVPPDMSAESLAELQGRVDDAWVSYLASVDIGPSEVVLSKLVALLIDAGAVDVRDVVFQAAGAVWPVNVIVSDGFVPVAKPAISSTLGWASS